MSGAAEKIWRPLAQDDDAAGKLALALSLPLPIARVLVARGYADAAATEFFLKPRLSELGMPEELSGLLCAAERIWSAIDRGERIVVFGDYDVDGVTSTALMVQVLRRLGADVKPFLPHRIEEGYGLSLDALHRCMEEFDPDLIVTVDCGTGSVAAVEEAKGCEADVIITDHHQPGDQIAPAFAVVNPKLGANEDLKNLAGVGVAFKLCHGLVKMGRAQNRECATLDLRSYLDLVALGTIADVVPLVGENRILCSFGLKQFGATVHEGLKALVDVAGIKAEVGAYHVGFQLGPRLNAAGRLGGAEDALNLLLSSDSGAAAELTGRLNEANRERQDTEAEILAAAMDELESRFDAERDFGLVVAGDGWSPGVIGIVASRLVQRFYRPVVVIAKSEEGGRGSCRSIEGFDMVSGLRACSEHLSAFGGHVMAAGLELKPGQLEAFAESFNAAAKAALGGQELRPSLRIDAGILLDEVDDLLYGAQEQMRPFGMGNPTPVWLATGVQVVGQPRILKEKHLKLLVASGGRQFEALGWGMAGRAIPEGALDIAFQIKENHFQGQRRLTLELQDFRSAKK